MLSVETRHAVHQSQAKTFDTAELRKHFLAEGLFAEREIRLVYTHYERFVLGGAVPSGGELKLGKIEETKTDDFLDRREMGIVNVGATGTVRAGGESWEMDRGDVLYLGRGAGPVTFAGDGRFYITSAPAHATYPNRLIRIDEAKTIELGDAATANKRVIYQFIHPLVMESCQLVLGYTKLAGGSVWNTYPPHMHDRRIEVYFYWDMSEDARVIHLMGEPQETRHLVVAPEQATIGPPWSIHSGAGTEAYTFVWAMAGENVDYTDMDHLKPSELR